MWKDGALGKRFGEEVKWLEQGQTTRDVQAEESKHRCEHRVKDGTRVFIDCIDHVVRSD